MRTLHSFATICVFAVSALVAACGSTDNGGGSGTPESRGATVWSDQACASCHGEDAKGNQGPNITMSMTAGIGKWTFQQFSDAVRLGKRNDGTQLCALMTIFTKDDINDAQMSDLYAYVKSKPVSDVVNPGTYCPTH